MTLENICLPTLGMLKLLTRIEMSIPGWSLPARTSKDTFGFQPNILWALLLSPCRCSCCWNKKEITQERKRQKNKQSGFRLCVTISLSLSLSPPLPLSGRRQRSEILAVINPLSWLFNHAFVQTSLFVPDGPGHDELWDSCGTTFPTSSEASPPPSPAGFCPGFDIQLKPGSVQDARNKLLLLRTRFWLGPTSAVRLKEVW